MAGGLKQKNVLVLGCGPVGQAAAQALVKHGSIVSIYDINLLSCEKLVTSIKQRLNTEINIEKELDHALENHQFIIDATPAADIIRKHHISGHTHISAPGVPLGLDEKAQVKISNRLLHDPLQIGVATMITFALKPYSED
jgi:pyrrolysine biosynthesis protein PylD